MAFNILDSLNNNSKNVVEDKPSANFRTKDISIFNIYRNYKNFYQIIDIEELANSILLVGLMSNLVVVYEPKEGKEYKLISGERRLEALKSLYEKGHKEYEHVTCQIKKEASEEEEEIEIIIANSSRVKTVNEMLQEEAKLKTNLQKMKQEGKQLKGYDLSKGRLRDVVASILGVSKTKVAQMENINNNLHNDFRKELDEGNINFATANEIAGIDKKKQQEIYEKTKDNISGLKVQHIKDFKKEFKDENIKGQIDVEEALQNIESENKKISNLDKIKTFDTIYMSEFMFRMINRQCKICPIGSKGKCIFYNTEEVTDRLCKKQIRIWLEIENMLEAEFPG